ncbi:MAG: 3-oxoacid CoA-transferase subunit B [Gammaproteobacteria bacterium]|nr:3-oxoacid CoA-transferase subunit B [Gammaproteobacteria bacterium]
MSTGWTREQMAARAAQDIPDGSYVNLGIGIPELVAKFVPEGREFIYHTENGMLGMGPPPADDERDLDLMNAGKKYVTALPGASYFHHADSFSMIRGGHIDVCVLGTMQVSANGDIANWSTGAPDAIPAVGGAMDLVQGVKNIFVITQHTTRDGEPKLIEKCTYPLTGVGVVSRIFTDLAVVDITPKGFQVVELAPGIGFDEVQQKTGTAILPPT